MQKNPAKLTAEVLLHGVDAELQRCLELLSRIEGEVLPLVSHALTPSLRAALQDIDLLSQCIDDISRCVRGIGTTKVAEVHLDAEAILSNIRLQDMRIRLEVGSFDARKSQVRDDIFDASSTTNGGHQLF